MDKNSFITGFIASIAFSVLIFFVYLGQYHLDKQKYNALQKAVETVVTQCGE